MQTVRRYADNRRVRRNARNPTMTTNLPQIRERIGAADFQTVAKFLPASELGGTLAVSENEKAVVMRGGRVVDMFSGRSGRTQTDSEVVVASLRQYHMIIGFGDCSRSPYNQPPMRIHAAAPEFQASNGEAIRSMTVAIAFSLVRDDRANVEKLLSLNSERKDAITVQDLASDLTLPPFIVAAFASAEASGERSIRFDEPHSDKVRERILMAANMMLEQYGVSASRVALSVNATSRDAELALPEVEREINAEHAAEMARLNTRVTRIDAQIEAERRMLELDELSHQREMLRTAMIRHWEERAEIQARIEFLDPQPLADPPGYYAPGGYSPDAYEGSPPAPVASPVSPTFWLHEDEAEVTLHASDCEYVKKWGKPPRWTEFASESDALDSTDRPVRGCRDCHPLPGDAEFGVVSIHKAAEEGYTQRVLELISAGADINRADPSGAIPLEYAETGDHVEIVQALILAGSDIPSQSGSSQTPIHWAIGRGHSGLAKSLIDNGADIHAPDGNNDTPLHSAVRGGNAEGVQMLIAAGADIHAKNKDGDTPLHSAIRNGNAEVFQTLTSAGADISVDDKDGNMVLHGTLVDRVIRDGNVELFQMLLDSAADIHADDKDGDTLLHSAVRGGNVKLVQTLISAGADIHARDGNNDTPLHHALRDGNDEIIQTLISAGADINARDRSIDTPLHHALRDGNDEIVQTLISAGADIHARHKDGNTPLHAAASTGRTEIVLALINAGADIHDWGRYGDTPLHAAASNGKTETALALINAGASINAKNRYRNTPLHVAASNGKTEVALALINVGADIHAEDDIFGTPLHSAASNGNTETALALISAGANVNAQANNGITPMRIASDKGHTETERALIRAGAVPRKSWLSRLMSR